MVLLEWSRERGIRLIIDESFLDFARSGENISLLNNPMLADNPHLVVIKSISKSYGVPGLRLGMAATSDMELINKCGRMFLSGISTHLQSSTCRFMESMKGLSKGLPGLHC